jgi:hypothetical protein
LIDVLTEDPARRIASNIAELRVLLGAADNSELDFQKAAVESADFGPGALRQKGPLAKPSLVQSPVFVYPV